MRREGGRQGSRLYRDGVDCCGKVIVLLKVSNHRYTPTLRFISLAVESHDYLHPHLSLKHSSDPISSIPSAKMVKRENPGITLE